MKLRALAEQRRSEKTMTKPRKLKPLSADDLAVMQATVPLMGEPHAWDLLATLLDRADRPNVPPEKKAAVRRVLPGAVKSLKRALQQAAPLKLGPGRAEVVEELLATGRRVNAEVERLRKPARAVARAHRQR